MAPNYLIYLLIILLIWLLVLSIYLLKTVSHYKNLIKSASGRGNLDKILESIIANQSKNSSQIADLIKESYSSQKKAETFIQKFSIIRFNPFEDAGGDQSFALALLDGQNNGVVISSLHSRGNTRVYAKPVTDGKPQVHKFSKEEKEAVEKAVLAKNKNRL